MPQVDLHEPWVKTFLAISGAYDHGLKAVAKALAKAAPIHAVEWPDERDIGLAAMVAGWQANARPAPPLESDEMKRLRRYLEIDVNAMWQILRWMRAVAT